MPRIRTAKSSGETTKISAEVKRAQIPVRTTPAMKDRLIDAATANDRSLTQEIEQRLERSLEDERRHGSAGAEALARLISTEAYLVERETGKTWMDDVATHAAVFELVKSRLRHARPRFKNADAIVATWKAFKEAERAVEARLTALLEMGAIEYRGALSAPSALAGLGSPVDDRELHIILEHKNMRLTFDYSLPVREWKIKGRDGKHLSEAELIGVHAILRGLGEKVAGWIAANDASLDAWAEDEIEVEKGKAIAARLLGSATIPQTQETPEDGPQL